MAEEAIYLDNNSSTPLDPEVLEVVNVANSQFYGNPSNILHHLGKKANQLLDNARERIRHLLQAKDFQVIFTSGATEAINLAIQGLNPSRIIVGSTEHSAVLNTCRWLAKVNKTIVDIFPVDGNGIAKISKIEESLQHPTSLLIAMAANNETGVIHPIDKIGHIASKKGVPLLCDATQAVGKLPISLDNSDIDMLTFSGHKIYGPKGIGVLLYRQDSLNGKIHPIIHGGGQEYGLRSGTENVPAILGLVKALELAVTSQSIEAFRLKNLRDNFESLLYQQPFSIIVNGYNVERLPNTSNFSISDIKIESFLKNLSSIAISVGSACATQKYGGSHVLRAMKIPEEQVYNSIRVSFGRFNNIKDPQLAVEAIYRSVITSVEKDL